MRPADEFDAITIAGTMQGGCRQLKCWQVFDRGCHGGRKNLPTISAWQKYRFPLK